MTMNKVVLDTNVLVYSLDAQSNFHASAVAVLKDPSFELLVPTKVISEFFAVCSKLNVSFANAMSFYREIQRNASFLYPSATSIGYFEELLQLYQPRGNRIFDMEIVSVAMANGVDVIVTANVNDFLGIAGIGLLPLTKEIR